MKHGIRIKVEACGYTVTYGDIVEVSIRIHSCILGGCR